MGKTLNATIRKAKGIITLFSTTSRKAGAVKHANVINKETDKDKKQSFIAFFKSATRKPASMLMNRANRNDSSEKSCTLMRDVKLARDMHKDHAPIKVNLPSFTLTKVR